MASAKQIAWRKKFARMSKAGKFRKKKSSTKSKGKKATRLIHSNPRNLSQRWLDFYSEDNYDDVEYPRVRQLGFKDVLKEINTYKKWLERERVFAREADEIKVINYYLGQS